MRIITGKYKGRVIKMPRGIRPTQNKVRKAVFDILGDIKGLSFLELFAGSGAVGFEAVSRGIAELSLVEDDPNCLLTIRQNLESVRLQNCSLYPQGTQNAVKAFHKQCRRFDIIFLDPPYYKRLASRPYDKLNKRGSGLTAAGFNDSLAKKTLQILVAYDILAPNGFVIVQHFKQDNLPESVGDLKLFRQARYGDTLLSLYRK